MEKTQGKNWNSKQREYIPIKKRSTKEKARIANKLYEDGHTVRYIARHMELSASRIYEYIRK